MSRVTRPAPWRTTRFVLPMERVLVMGIVNLTPDSFSDGGRLRNEREALQRCETLLREGADILDLGGESTRPGAPRVPVDEELRRVLPIARAATALGVPISVDTSKPEVMQAVLDVGVDIINDVLALRAPAALAVLAAHPSAGCCLMHMKGTPQDMQAQAQYADVVAEVAQFFDDAVARATAAGIAAERIALDPGYGFAKTAEQGWTLLARQRALFDTPSRAQRPLLVGLSRKSMLGAATGRAVGERLAASVAAAVLAAERGANIVRVHDVAATVDALKVRACLQRADDEAGAP